MVLALHTCCGPCAASVVPQLRESGVEPLAYYVNPNIHPAMEWIRRLEALEQYAASADVTWAFEPDYGLSRFIRVVGAEGGQDRCERCFALRLGATGEWAASQGLSEFTTTLLTSPYQDREMILRVGREVARRIGLVFREADFRPGFRAGQAHAKELGLYRQAYCGCVFSEEERYRGRLEKVYARGVVSPPRE